MQINLNKRHAPTQPNHPHIVLVGQSLMVLGLVLGLTNVLGGTVLALQADGAIDSEVADDRIAGGKQCEAHDDTW